MDMVLKEIEKSAAQSCKEFWLTSQDNASYGMDTGESLLPELLTKIGSIRGEFFVRNGMVNPKNVMLIKDELAKSYNSPKIYKFLHLPIQSADDTVLSSMNRGYTVKDFEGILKSFSDFRLNFWTDIIVGFPGETDEQFKNTVSFVKREKPDWINVSKFGLRPNTPAGDMEQVTPEVINIRSEELSEIARKVSLEKNRKWVGWEGDVLFLKKGRKRGQWLGRNPSYKLVMVESDKKLVGKAVKVLVDNATYSHISGSLS